jgi:ribosomal protein S25
MEMEDKRKRGRPKKANAKKPGELNKGLRRYTFVADKKMIEKIKKEAKRQKISIKELMSRIINNGIQNTS